jgi:hypothetical protein
MNVMAHIADDIMQQTVLSRMQISVIEHVTTIRQSPLIGGISVYSRECKHQHVHLDRM